MNQNACIWNGVEYDSYQQAYKASSKCYSNATHKRYSYRTFVRMVKRGITCDADVVLLSPGRKGIPYQDMPSRAAYAEKEGISPQLLNYRIKKENQID